MGKGKRRRYPNFLKSWSFVLFSLTNKPAKEKKKKIELKNKPKGKKGNKNLSHLLPTIWSFHRQTTSSRTSLPASSSLPPSTTTATAVSIASAMLETQSQGNDSHWPEYDPDLNPNRTGFLICLLFISPCCFSFVISGSVKVVLK